jgi:parallel beta-helix repeat protein
VISNSTIRRNGGDGIGAAGIDQVKIHDNTIRSNTGNGINVRHDAEIEHNDIVGNGQGILLSGNGTTVSDNTVNANNSPSFGTPGKGIHSLSTSLNNVVTRNHAGGNNAGNYANDGGASDFGPTGTAATATSPWANISH